MGTRPFNTLHEFYADGHEAGRLRTARGRLEHLRISDLNDRFLPCPPATILDIGGGTGPYAHPLAAAGYSVHLLDATPLHVVEAIKAASPEHPLTSATVGDARALPFEDALADAALLFGPLYHLHDRSDRLLALREAHRVLRPGGRLFATAISRYASLHEGLFDGLLTDTAFQEIVAQDLQTGEHRNPGRRPDWFTDAHFHLPNEFRAELAEAGFLLKTLVGVEAVARYLADLAQWLEDPQRCRILLDTLRLIETEEPILGISTHLYAVAER